MLYFAYGSNLNWERMKNRCPSAEFWCKASLPDYRIDFTRWSKTNECGVADIVWKKNNKVHGAVYKINEEDLGRLDKSEGYTPKREINCYRRIEILVFKDENKKEPITAFTYEVEKKEFGKYKPKKEYKNLIVSGAKHWKLPGEYINFLENIEIMKGK